jgi:glycosyltransferase 2 family protein
MLKNGGQSSIKSNNWKLLIGFVITIPFVFFALFKMDLKKALSVWHGLEFYWFFPFLLSMCFAFLFRALCWSKLLEAIQETSLYNLVKAIIIGFFGNMVFPVRLGELIRTFIISKQEKIKFIGVLATVVTTRVMDLINVVIFSLVTIFLTGDKLFPTSLLANIKSNGAILATISLVMLLIFYLCLINKNKLNAFLKKIDSIIPINLTDSLKPHLDSFMNGLNNLKNPIKVVISLSFSMLMWWCTLLTFYFALLMFSFEATFEKSAVLTVALAFGKLIPSSPGFIGPLQASIVFALSLYGFDTNIALGFAIFYHVITFFCSFVLASFSLWSNRMSLFEIKSSLNQATR